MSSAVAGTTGACFDVLCVGVRYVLGNWPSKVCSHLPESRVDPSKAGCLVSGMKAGRKPSQELVGSPVWAGSLWWLPIWSTYEVGGQHNQSVTEHTSVYCGGVPAWDVAAIA